MKEDLRKDLLKKRKDLSRSNVLKKSSKIEKRLFNMNEYKESQVIFYYISYNNEVYTHDMIKNSLLEEKDIVVPLSDKKNRTLILSKLDKWEDLEIGSYDILEPKKECMKKISIDKIDLFIIPGVGFDKNGNRIGHGMGYVDKLLKASNYRKHIGLSFELQIVDLIPIENHDILVNKIITEKRIINCNSYH
jgi:5-formyltetrahydrofolate cyclo-ligase